MWYRIGFSTTGSSIFSVGPGFPVMFSRISCWTRQVLREQGKSSLHTLQRLQTRRTTIFAGALIHPRKFCRWYLTPPPKISEHHPVPYGWTVIALSDSWLLTSGRNCNLTTHRFHEFQSPCEWTLESERWLRCLPPLQSPHQSLLTLRLSWSAGECYASITA